MLTEIYNFALYGATLLSLFVIDHLLGHGFVDIFQKIFCQMVCFIKKTIKDEDKSNTIIKDNAVSFTVLFAEVMCLGLTITFFNKYKQLRGKDRIDELLQESREALRQTNEFLEKWRLRRINCQVLEEYSYLDDEPQEIKPYKLEVPILHMAIIDTLGTARNQPESGDAGDTTSITDYTLLTLTSLIDDDLESISDSPSEHRIVDSKSIEYGNRLLWDVLEEDFVIED